jgi:hypothetical protein
VEPGKGDGERDRPCGRKQIIRWPSLRPSQGSSVAKRWSGERELADCGDGERRQEDDNTVRTSDPYSERERTGPEERLRMVLDASDASPSSPQSLSGPKVAWSVVGHRKESAYGHVTLSILQRVSA